MRRMNTRGSLGCSLIFLSAAVLVPVAALATDDIIADAPLTPGVVTQAPDCLTPTRTVDPQTIVGVWNCAALVEVRASKALRNGPPIVARTLAIVHTCI